MMIDTRFRFRRSNRTFLLDGAAVEGFDVLTTGFFAVVEALVAVGREAVPPLAA